ncbi:WD40 repeat domain-containing protein [Lewinella cohaerens]|uniref:WD40 repeat domain-containing protein n=1 Tax=Lewinella cohaerens TaxID=70995 RepID=UPI000364D445|nr:hypothetical protein [Lewinella cohaerens]
MHYELTHDTIAQQVYEKASTEARTRRKVERYISERHQAYHDRQVYLTQDDIDFVWPYLDQVNSSGEELVFLQRGKQRLQRRRRLRLFLLTTISIAFGVLALVANSQRNAAEQREQESKSMRVSLAARYALYEGSPREAFRLAEQTLLWDNDENAKTIAREVLLEIQANPLVSSIHHEDTIVALQFSRDGSFFMSASQDGEVRISNLKREILKKIAYKEGLSWAELLPDNERVVSLSRRGELQLWNVTNNKVQPLTGQIEFMKARVSPDGSRLGAIAKEQVYVWDLRQPTEQPIVVSMQAPVTAIDFLQVDTGWDLVTASKATEIKRWNAVGEEVMAYRNVLGRPVTGISISPNNDKMVFRTTTGDFMLANNGDTLRTRTSLLFRAYQPIQSKFVPSRMPEKIVSISRDRNIVYVWNTGSTQSDLDLQWLPKGKAQFAIMSDNGRYLVGASDNNETLVQQVVDSLMEQNQELFRFNNRILWGVYAPNNVHFLSAGGNNQALLWKFDFDYVADKKALSEQQLIQYYQTRLHPFSPEEQAYYQLK